MRQTNKSNGTVSLGDVIAASCELGYSVASDRHRAMGLAARHLARVLVRAKKAKLAATLAAMAREFPAATDPAAGGA